MAPIRPLLRAENITDQQWRVMRVLNDSGPLDATQLAQRALLHAPSVTRILRELVGRGLVTREPDPTDARRSNVDLTEEGAGLVKRTAASTRGVLEVYSQRFGAERLANLRSELSALADTIGDL